MSARHVSMAALAAAILAIGAPAWPCGPPGSMGNSGGDAPGNANNSGMGGQGQNDNTGSGASNWNNSNGAGGNANGDANGGSPGGDNAGGENARQGASEQANRDLNGGDDNSGGRRSSGGDNQNGANYSNQIGSLGGAQANNAGEECESLRSQLAALQRGDKSETEEGIDRLAMQVPRAMQMTPAMLDKLIAEEQTRLDDQQAREQQRARLMFGDTRPVPKRSSGLLNFLYDLRAARLAGVGEDGMQRRADQIMARVREASFTLRARRDQAIRDVQNRLANLNCDNVGSPSPAPSPNQ